MLGALAFAYIFLLSLYCLLGHNCIQHSFHIYSNSGKKIPIEALMNDINKDTWNKTMSMERGQLVQGNTHGVSVTDTIDFVHQNEVPS